MQNRVQNKTGLMEYLIGIDGGGTKTKCVLADSNKKILHECSGGPSNFLILGTETVSETLFKLIEECKEKLQISYSEISVVLGTTGAGRRSDAETLEKAFANYCQSKSIQLKSFRVESDARIALEGAFSGNPGSILIAGTGSIMFGKDAKENIHRVGGFGRYIGDEGSGFAIGKKGLIAASRAFDGRGGKTTLLNLLAEKFKIDTPENLIIEVYRNNFDIASAAPLVFEAAEQNDPACLKIIEEETDELLLHLVTMHEKINETVLHVSFIGGLISSDNIYSRTLLKKIKDSPVDIHIKPADHPPAMGAVLMAAK